MMMPCQRNCFSAVAGFAGCSWATAVRTPYPANTIEATSRQNTTLLMTSSNRPRAARGHDHSSNFTFRSLLSRSIEPSFHKCKGFVLLAHLIPSGEVYQGREQIKRYHASRVRTPSATGVRLPHAAARAGADTCHFEPDRRHMVPGRADGR